MTPRLIAVEARPGPAFLDALRRAWGDGDAVLPVDPRLPAPVAHALLDELGAGDPVESGDALVVATSGTTGDPKGVVLTHEAVTAAATITSAAIGVDPERDRWLCKLPLSHMGGLGVVTRWLCTGTPVTFDTADPAATLTAAVPTQLEREDHSRFRVVLVGGSADWRAERTANVVRTYGLTETGGGVVYDGFALPGVEMRIAADGEVLLRSPSLLRCYRDGTDPKDADGWLPTGDDGALDAGSGRLTVFGRRGDLIVTGGEKVWPEPVERVLRGVVGVADVAVIGRADPEWGQAVTAVVVPADSSAPPDLVVLRAAVRAVLPAWSVPKALELVDDLPRTSIGKLRRAAL
ncbi:MAG: AMP-binding protein [Actinomycetota bacterium]|nr:AMP-binding protein [Acidimicrobiia bacterium]MDQ3294452.1 AMP-binding protein [Actinomycetota bacterium]